MVERNFKTIIIKIDMVIKVMNKMFQLELPILTDDYVDKAEKVIRKLDNSGKYEKGPSKGKMKFKLTSTQIRNLAALTSNLFDESKQNDIEELRKIHLRIQFVY